LLIVSEYAPHGSLLNFLRERRPSSLLPFSDFLSTSTLRHSDHHYSYVHHNSNNDNLSVNTPPMLSPRQRNATGRLAPALCHNLLTSITSNNGVQNTVVRANGNDFQLAESPSLLPSADYGASRVLDRLRLRDLLDFAAQIAEGLQYLASRKVSKQVDFGEIDRFSPCFLPFFHSNCTEVKSSPLFYILVGFCAM
jgi:hypothetical protein